MNAHGMMFLGVHRGAEPGSEPGARNCECRAPALVPMLSVPPKGTGASSPDCSHALIDLVLLTSDLI